VTVAAVDALVIAPALAGSFQAAPPGVGDRPPLRPATSLPWVP
jgi:hypothetical protein